MEKGKPILIDSKVLGEIMRTHSPACLMAAAEILAAAGCDEKGEVVPLRMNGKAVHVMREGGSYRVKNDYNLSTPCDTDWLLAAPAELARLRKELGVPEAEQTCATCDMRDVCRVVPERCSNWEPRHD